MAENCMGNEPGVSVEQTSSLGNFGSENVGFIRPGRDIPLRLSAIRESYPEVYQTLESEFDRICDGLLSNVLRANEGTTRRYLSDVVTIESDGQAERLSSLLASSGAAHRGNIFFWRREPTHFHVVHDCTYSGNYCRCAWTRNPDFRNYVRKPIRQRQYIDKFSSANWINILLYFALHKGLLPGQVYIAGICQRLYNKAEFLQRCEDVGQWQQRVLEVQGKGTFVYDESQQRSKRSFESTFNESTSTAGKKRSKFEVVIQTIQTLLNKFNRVWGHRSIFI